MVDTSLHSLSSLGTNTGIASTPKKLDKTHASVSLKYRMQDGARKLLPSERVAGCIRRLQPGRTAPDVLYNPGAGTAHYGGCIVCGSVWTCPVCAARISELRRRELTAALARTDKYAVLVTYTVRHNRYDKLSFLLSAFLEAIRSFKSGRWFNDFKSEWGWFGSVRALETTHGSKGWHPHGHELVLLDRPTFDHVEDPHQRAARRAAWRPDINQMQHLMRKRWMDVLPHHGLDCAYEVGIRIVDDSEYVREYVAKFGREPLVERGGKSWTVAHELAKSNVKRSRDFEGGRSPFQLLYDYIEGDKRAGALFAEYAKVFKGRNQLVWSRGLKSELGISDISDEEAAGEIDTRVERLTSLDYWEWQAVCEMGCRGALLEVAKSGDAALVIEFVAKVVYFYKQNMKRSGLADPDIGT